MEINKILLVIPGAYWEEAGNLKNELTAYRDPNGKRLTPWQYAALLYSIGRSHGEEDALSRIKYLEDNEKMLKAQIEQIQSTQDVKLEEMPHE